MPKSKTIFTAPVPITGLALVTAVSQLPDIATNPSVIVIPGQAATPHNFGPELPRLSLAQLIAAGSAYHDAAAPGAFVEVLQVGYYAWERRIVYRTCPVAAAYVGAFGPDSIERPAFSYTQAIYRLSRRVGYDLEVPVVDPLGKRGPLVERIIKLTDDHKWDRAGIIEWVSEVERTQIHQGIAADLRPLIYSL